MNKEDLPYRIALTQIPHIGPVHARLLLEHFPTARDIFRATRRALETIPGIGTVRANSIHGFREFQRMEKESRFLEKYGIQAIGIEHEAYPFRLRECFDAPSLIFFRGSVSLNEHRVIGIIGTRSPTEYGREATAQIVKALTPYQPIVLSGLAYGIDTLAHQNALKQNLGTIGILAHGLDRIYPSANKSLAREMLGMGGLVSDFISGTNPDAQNFPRRNRIVAGMADAVIVIETGDKGGSMITANMANGYNREVFALPGRITDFKSGGCLSLISSNRAHLLQEVSQVTEILGWEKVKEDVDPSGAHDYSSLTPIAQQILAALDNKESAEWDEIQHATGLAAGTLAGVLLDLEIQQWIRPLPGKRYRSCVSSGGRPSP